MKSIVVALSITVIAISSLPAQESSPAAAEKAVAAVIAQYNRGLNTGDLDAVVEVFGPDGVWMALDQPAVSGEALRQWFINYWKNTVADLKFTPELIRIEGSMAYAVVNITGTTTPKAGGPSRAQD